MPDSERNHAQADHDLLIRLDTKMDRAAQDISAVDKKISSVSHELGVMAEGLEVKIAAAVSGKADTQRVLEIKGEQDKKIEDHEQRVRRLERYAWSAIGVLAVAEVVIAVVK